MKETNNPNQNQQPNQNEQSIKIKERLLDIESLLLLLDSDPCLQEYHFRVIRMIHNLLKEIVSATDFQSEV